MKWTPKAVAITAGVAVLGAWYLKNQAGAAVKKAGQAINPTNRENVFYKGVNSVGGAVSGDDEFSLGSWIYDQVHDE